MARRRNNRKWAIGGVILVVLVIAGIVTFVIWNNSQEAEQNDEVGITEVEEVKDTEKNDGETEEEYSERMAEQKRVKQYEGEDPNKAEELSGAVTYSGVNNNVLMIQESLITYLRDKGY